MSSLSWDFPSSSTNPSDPDEDRSEASEVDLTEEEASEHEQIEAMERELLEQLGQDQIEALERQQIESLGGDEQEQLDRGQLEALEREQLERLAQLEGVEIELSEQSEREQLEELEREQLRQLERLVPQRDADAAASTDRSEPPPAEPPRPAAPPREAPFFAPAAETPPVIDTDALAAQFLAASQRRTLDEAAYASAPATERRELDERARAARAIVEQCHQSLVESHALLADARRVLTPIAYRGLSDRTYLRRKIILGIGEAVSLAVAFSTAFDVAPLEGLLLSGAIALAFVIAGDLGGILRLTAERSRLSAAVEDGVAQLDPRYLHILYYERQPWLSIVGGVTAGILALAAVSVGVLRAANQGSFGLAAGLGLLTVSLAIAAGVSSWQHASIGSEIIDHLQREEEMAGRRLKRAAASKALRGPQLFATVGTEDLGMPAPAAEVDWQALNLAAQAPNMDWQTPDVEIPTKRSKRAGRAKREKSAKSVKPAKGEKGPGLVGAAAARGAMMLASVPGKLRRSDRSDRSAKAKSKGKGADDDYESGPGPGAGGESAGPISDISFTPPVRITKRFP